MILKEHEGEMTKVLKILEGRQQNMITKNSEQMANEGGKEKLGHDKIIFSSDDLRDAGTNNWNEREGN